MTATLAAPIRKYHPQPKQESWHACRAYESGFGGAKFGGKTLALLMKAATGIAHPQYDGIIFRRTFPRLQEVVDRSWEWFPQKGGRWDGEVHRWRFPSGASIWLRHCQHEESKRDYQGHQYSFMGFDQLEEFSETQYLYLLAQNRTPTADLKPYTRSTFNPGGIGHAWVKRRFIARGSTECSPWRARSELGAVLPSRCFHFANIDDNPIGEAADPGYRVRLEGQPEAERRAFLYGDWDSFSGQAFAEWSPAAHVVDSAALDPSWKRLRAIDYGIARPFVCLWLARDPDTGRIYVYREVSQAGVVPARAQAELVLGLTPPGEQINLSVADPSLWIRQEHGRSIADEYREAGLGLTRALNDRLIGKSRVHDYLAMGEDKKPRLLVFRRCARLIENLPALVSDPNRPEDVDTDGPDDEYDALRYGLMALPLLGASLDEYATEFEYADNLELAENLVPGRRRTALDDHREWQRRHRIVVTPGAAPPRPAGDLAHLFEEGR